MHADDAEVVVTSRTGCDCDVGGAEPCKAILPHCTLTMRAVYDVLNGGVHCVSISEQSLVYLDAVNLDINSNP